MKPYTKAMLSFAILVIIVITLFTFSDWFSKTTGYVLGEDEKAKLAQCLTSKNAILYIGESCNKCDEQIALFGEEPATLLNIKTCTNPEECPLGVPAWTVGTEPLVGVIQLEKLIEVSGCRTE